MRRIMLGALLAPLLLLGIGLFSYANAQTASAIQAQIDLLIQQITQLQAEIQARIAAQGGSVPQPLPNYGTPTSSSFGLCPILGRNLRQGVSGGDVANLQAFLAGDVSIYPEANISAYFGALTQAAVQRFQIRYGVVTSGTPDTTGFGAVGPATRAAINRVCRPNGTSIPTPTPTPIPTPLPQASCFIGNTTVPSGSSITLYSVTAAPTSATCAQYSQLRQCVNGTLAGISVFLYPTCLEASQTRCTVGTTTLEHTMSRTFYSRQSVNWDESCSSFDQTRTCTNGSLSGSSNYSYPSCTVGAADSCTLSGIAIAHGTSRTFYSQDTATSSASCSSYAQTRTCTDGALSGDSQYSKPSCSAGACFLDGKLLASGSSTTFYFAQNIPQGEQCSSYSLSRTCSGGTLGGNSAYKYASCALVTGGSCALDNVVLANGASRTFYSAATAPAGAACGSISLSRTCSNGTLMGTTTYNRAVCGDTQSCTVSGLTVTHGQSAVFYNTTAVAFGNTCSAASLNRTCTNGLLSGTSTYQFTSCRVNPPTTMVASQLATALTALEGALQKILDLLR